MLSDFDESAVFRHVMQGTPVRLDELPRDHGIYALHDHVGAIRYMGITAGDRLGFYGSIHGRHSADSESRSHKSSHAYNTGHLYRAKKDERPDALLEDVSPNHGWRHTFCAVAEASGISKRFSIVITGHNKRKDASDGYVTPRVQQMATEMIKFPAFPLQGLRQTKVG